MDVFIYSYGKLKSLCFKQTGKVERQCEYKVSKPVTITKTIVKISKTICNLRTFLSLSPAYFAELSISFIPVCLDTTVNERPFSFVDKPSVPYTYNLSQTEGPLTGILERHKNRERESAKMTTTILLIDVML